MSPHGVAVVARQEFRLRIRTGRWRWLLAAWFLVVSGITALLYAAVNQVVQRIDDGAVMYGGLMFFVLALAALVAPALAAQSVNGDRERGVLATLQVTTLSAGDIAVGKLIAAWGTALVFLLLTVPHVLVCVVAGGVSLARVAAVTAVVALLLGIICAIALALSALLRRTTTSGLLSYIAVFSLAIGTLVLFGLVSATTADEVERPIVNYVCQASTDPQQGENCHEEDTGQTYTTTQWRTDRTWFLLAPNPFVILADAAPRTAGHRSDDIDILGQISRNARGLRAAPGESDSEGGRVWPLGLAVDLTLAIGAMVLTTRRLQTPVRKLGKGARIA